MLKRSLLTLSIITILAGCSLDGDDGAAGAAGPAGPTGGTGPSGQPGKNLPRDLNIEVVGRY